MTKNQSWPVEAFIAEVAKAYPRLRISCDMPEQAAGSTYIDIRVGDALVVVEHQADRGFGFSDAAAENSLYGTPSAVFLREVDEAFAYLERLLARAATIGAREAVRHDA